MARQCYVTSVREIKDDVIQLSELEHHGILVQVEELAEIELKLGRKFIVGRDLDATIMAKLISCLSHNIDVFA